MAKNSCWNKISDNVIYIISEIKNDMPSRTERKKENDRKKPKSLILITVELKEIYDNLYDINLFIYKSEKESTIIEIQYFPKSAHPSNFYETIKHNAPMLHSKLAIPNYRKKDTDKIDVNWELGGIRHELNNICGKIRYYIWKYNYDRMHR